MIVDVTTVTYTPTSSSGEKPQKPPTTTITVTKLGTPTRFTAPAVPKDYLTTSTITTKSTKVVDGNTTTETGAGAIKIEEGTLAWELRELQALVNYRPGVLAEAMAQNNAIIQYYTPTP